MTPARRKDVDEPGGSREDVVVIEAAIYGMRLQGGQADDRGGVRTVGGQS